MCARMFVFEINLFLGVIFFFLAVDRFGMLDRNSNFNCFTFFIHSPLRMAIANGLQKKLYLTYLVGR